MADPSPSLPVLLGSFCAQQHAPATLAKSGSGTVKAESRLPPRMLSIERPLSMDQTPVLHDGEGGQLMFPPTPSPVGAPRSTRGLPGMGRFASSSPPCSPLLKSARPAGVSQMPAQYHPAMHHTWFQPSMTEPWPFAASHMGATGMGFPPGPPALQHAAPSLAASDRAAMFERMAPGPVGESPLFGQLAPGFGEAFFEPFASGMPPLVPTHQTLQHLPEYPPAAHLQLGTGLGYFPTVEHSMGAEPHLSAVPCGRTLALATATTVRAAPPANVPGPVLLGGARAQLSEGSAFHDGAGSCRPCAWYWKPKGCSVGWDCSYCHTCPDGEIKRRKKAKITAMREVEARSRDQVSSPWPM